MNGFPPKEATELGILIDENLHKAKARHPMASTDSGIVIDPKLRQLSKALSPIEVTETAILARTMFVQCENARLLMKVVPPKTTADYQLSKDMPWRVISFFCFG